MRPILTPATTLACLGVAALLAAAPARAGAPVFHITPDTLSADMDGEWRANLVLENHGEWGLYPDSLAMDWVSADPDSGNRPRRGTRDLNSLVRLATPASAGEATGVGWTSPAEFDRGTLVFRIGAHDAQKTRYSLTATVRVLGSALSDAFPSELLKAGAQQVELVVVTPEEAQQPTPALLYVPPAGTDARSLLRWTLMFRSRGYTVGVVSPPGSGRSSGAWDQSGPASVAGVAAALDRLARVPGVDGKRMLLWGQGDGATTALLAGVRHPELAGIVALDASYDPWATYRALPDSAKAAFTRAAGRDSAAWRVRSPLAAAATIAAPVLVLQTLESGIASSAPAEAFAAVRNGRELYVEARMNGLEAAPFRRRDAMRVAVDFMQRRTRKP
jgi:pimeloyl-ACP methyl ester carboxylesterase